MAHGGLTDRTGPLVDPQHPLWNHNIQYYADVLAAVPPGARTALDVGCGAGMLTRALRARVPEVVGIDPHAASLAAALSVPGDPITYRQVCLFEDHLLPDDHFDLVACVGALHHMDAAPALSRMAHLVRPGGSLVVIGPGRAAARDLPWLLAGMVAHRLAIRRNSYWEFPAPPAKPGHTHREIAAIAAAALPGVRFRRRLYFRYTLVWQRPT
ncbi:MAG TPA: class I SAM-dependent methyltransferase [Sporichthyaceae bacterium]|nr:class I SAM-dependent methyltransferase [Sporichthyaceae bacterium]